jgi:hypothetical protein
MPKRRKRRSAAALDSRVLKAIRSLHRAHLKEISAVLSNALGFAVTVRPVRAPEVLQIPRSVRGKKRGGAGVDRHVAHVAGFGRDLPADLEPRAAPALPIDEVDL